MCAASDGDRAGECGERQMRAMGEQERDVGERKQEAEQWVTTSCAAAREGGTVGQKAEGSADG
jgi:hypothetical protein